MAGAVNPREWLREPALRARGRSKLLEPLWRRRFHSFGRGSILDWPTWLYGPHHIAIGAETMILRSAWLSAERPSWGEPAPILSIGNWVGIGPWCRISASESVVIEDYVVFAARVSVVDANHTHSTAEALAQPGYHHSVLGAPVTSSPVRIGHGTWIGENTVVLPGANIGRHCTVGANSVVRGEIPDFSVAVGSPARVIDSTNR